MLRRFDESIGDIEALAKAGSVLHLILYALLNVALIIFRMVDLLNYESDFTVPVHPYVPIVGVIISVGLIAFIVLIEIALSSVFILFSVGWCLVYTRQRIPGYNQRLVIKSL